ncbi:MAG: hypothetical protein MI784_00025, partial [Cytophagales bacterium]|nr:hypothetical protein [Cytophagales bacterium]
MTRLRTKRDGVRAANEAINSYKEQENELEAERLKIRKDIEGVKQTSKEIRRQLAENILVGISAEEVNKAARELSFMALPGMLDTLTQKREENIRRKKEIAGMSDFQNQELLIDPSSGEYTEKLEELSASLGELKKSLKRFTDIRGFQHLYDRKDRAEPTGFVKFIRIVTLVQFFSSKSYERKKGRVLTTLGSSSLETVFGEYSEILEAHDVLQKEYEKFDGLKKAVENLVAEHSELTNAIDNFEHITLSKLQGEILKHLELISASTGLREQVRKELSVIVTSLVVQEEKLN